MTKEVKDIIRKVCNVFELEIEQVLSNSRKAEICMCRQLISTALYTTAHYTLHQVGKLINNQNHATVINSISIVTNALENVDHNPYFLSYIEKLIFMYPEIKLPIISDNNRHEIMRKNRYAMFCELGEVVFDLADNKTPELEERKRVLLNELKARKSVVNYKAIRDSTNSSVLAAFNQTSTRIKIPPVQFNEIKLSNGN